MKHIRKSSIVFALVSSLALFSGCGIDNDGDNVVEVPGGDQFVSAEVIDDINSSVMLQVIKASIDANATNAFGYKAVKITYNTINQDDDTIQASGLLVIPTASAAYQEYRASIGENPFTVSMICENHGTIFTEAEAPTNVEVKNGMPDYSTAVLMTGFAGFAAIIPDYIGYGTSGWVSHPYMLKKASARSSLDMIKASMKYMNDNKIVLNYQLFVSGYSQGGHTAMALTEEIEKSFSDKVDLKGTASMAAPHDLEALGDIELDASHVMVYPAFLGYLADSYAYYHSDVNLSDVVLESNTTMYHDLFAGDTTNILIHESLGLTINGGFGAYTADKLFKTSLIDDYKNSLNTGLALRNYFIENSTYNWAPKSRVNLIHCIDDEIIPFSMSQKAYTSFISNGSSEDMITLSPIPSEYIPPASATDPFVHSRCGAAAYGTALKWFSAIRVGEI